MSFYVFVVVVKVLLFCFVMLDLCILCFLGDCSCYGEEMMNDEGFLLLSALILELPWLLSERERDSTTSFFGSSYVLVMIR